MGYYYNRMLCVPAPTITSAHRPSNTFEHCLYLCMYGINTNLAGHRWHDGHVTVHSCRVRRETVETVEETCDWALTVTSRSLWTTSSQRWCLLPRLRWSLGRSKVDWQDLRTWRPMSPTETCSALVWRSYVMTGRRSLTQQVVTRNCTSHRRLK